MKDCKRSLLQLLDECILVNFDMVLLALIDFREQQIGLLFGVGESLFCFSTSTSCWVFRVEIFIRAEVFVSVQLLTGYKASSGTSIWLLCSTQSYYQKTVLYLLFLDIVSSIYPTFECLGV